MLAGQLAEVFMYRHSSCVGCDDMIRALHYCDFVAEFKKWKKERNAGYFIDKPVNWCATLPVI
jgi:hypothetical protein